MTINSFLKKMATDIGLVNQDYSADDFYYILKYLGVKKDTSLVNDIEKFYEDFLDSLNNSLVKYETKNVKSGENITHYIGFYVDKKANFYEAVKVYFPVKYEYMISALKTIFLYLIRNNIKSQIKFFVKATNENIVIRFYEKKDIAPFINYCKNNFVLKDLLVSTNPFIATINGIGLVSDDNTVSTYNGTLSRLLSDYFKLYRSRNILETVSDISFLDYVMKRKEQAVNEERFNISAIEKNIRTILNHANPLDEKEYM